MVDSVNNTTSLSESLYSLIDEACCDTCDNIFVKKTGTNNVAAIYFSSNAIFYPDTPECFNKTILVENRFEWKKNLIKEASLHIFVRDIRKSWYLHGINDKYKDILSVTDFLRERCQGYNIITVGSSAGGFAAVLFGILIGAKKIYCFAAQFIIEQYTSLPYHYLQQVIHSPENKQFLNLLPLIQNFANPIYYFYPSGSQDDIEQAIFVKDIDFVRCFSIKSSSHGMPLTYESLETVLNLPQYLLDAEVTNTPLEPNHFFKKFNPWYFVLYANIKKRLRVLKKILVRLNSKRKK